MLAYLSRPRVWKRLVAAGPTDDAGLSAARGELAAIQAHYDGLLGELRHRRMTAGAFAAVEPGVLADLDAATKRVKELEAPPPLRFLLNGQGDLKARWEAAPVAARRDAIRKLARVTVRRSPQRGPVRVPAAQRTRIEWTAETLASDGS